MMVQVVSVATPQGLYRSIESTFIFRDARRQVGISRLIEWIGRSNLRDTQWTAGQYYMPDYLYPGENREYPESGIFFYPWVTRSDAYNKCLGGPQTDYHSSGNESIWDDPNNRFTLNSHRKLLEQPLGWIKGGKN
jgi:hypothetical protein